MAEIVDGIKFANIFDGRDGDVPTFQGRPSLSKEEQELLLAYLDEGAAILTFRSLAEDLLDPARPEKIPLVYQTDGTWVWSSESTYYLRHYSIAPDREFVEYIRSREYRYTAPATEQVEAASRAVQAQ